MAVRTNDAGVVIIKSMDDLRAMSVDEVNANWELVASFLKSGNAPRANPAPQTMEDLKRMGRDEILDHWPVVVKILEAQGEIDEAERKAKAQRHNKAVAA